MASRSRRVPLELRRRTEHSCDRCKTRKQKCIIGPEDDKCRHCCKYGYHCTVTKPRKQRFNGSLEAHGTRLAILESLVKGLMPEIDTSDLESIKETGRSLGIPLPADIAAGDEQGSTAVSAQHPVREDEHLVHDLQGQDQYIGRSSSYYFQMTLRTLVDRNHNGSVGRMYLFGPNPAATRPVTTSPLAIEGQVDMTDPTSVSDTTSPSSTISSMTENVQLEYTTISLLVRTYFEQINVDFPVLHEATFLEGLDGWRRQPSSADPTWLCTLFCVLILARRVCDVSLPGDQAHRWWSQIQTLLSNVIFTSSLTSIQVLMLAALHLHNTGSRDTCWTLTGAAVRIGFAIGLHRDNLDIKGTPLTLEMRKRVWWTLYAFEQLQVSSHDRPSAIDSTKHMGVSLRETILGMGAHNPPEYTVWSNRLLIMLGAACRAVPDADAYSGPLSPAAGLLRDLSRWRSTLPQHLRMDLIDAMPPSFQRPLILLHVQYHYTVSLISRNALLSRFANISKRQPKALPDSLVSMSDVCIESGRLSCRYLSTLDSMSKFNAVTWWDAYYLYSSTLVLVLSIVCDVRQCKRDSVAESQRLLRCCAETATEHLANAMVPGTMMRWLNVVLELDTMVSDFIHRNTQSSRTSDVLEGQEAALSSYCQPPLQSAGPSRINLNGAVTTTAFDDKMTTSASERWTSLGLEQDGSVLEMDLLDPSLQPGSESWGDSSVTHHAYAPQLWQDIHWEGISDLLLGIDSRSWNT